MKPEGLWRNADFVKLRLGMNVSFLGMQVSSLAYPLTAVPVLQASTAEMGWLRATLALGVCGLLLPFLRLFFSPVRRLRGVPASAEG